MKEKIKESLKSSRLDDKVLQKVKGGDCCCGCWYASSGGSSTHDNGMANLDGGGLHSDGCDVMVEE